MQVATIILWVVIAIAVNKLYLKMFNVIYFGQKGILRELITTVLVSEIILPILIGMLGNII